MSNVLPILLVFTVLKSSGFSYKGCLTPQSTDLLQLISPGYQAIACLNSHPTFLHNLAVLPFLLILPSLIFILALVVLNCCFGFG